MFSKKFDGTEFLFCFLSVFEENSHGETREGGTTCGDQENEEERIEIR